MTRTTPPAGRHAFMVKLVPPRTTFLHDASETERAIMREHSAYWRSHLHSGLVVAFGPVSDPDGAFGIGLLRAGSEAEVQALLANDPAIRAGIGMRALTYPMPALITREDV